MATAAPCMFGEIDQVLTSSLASLAAVESVNVLRVESEVCAWVVISEDTPEIRSAIYAVEDAIANRFPQIVIEFRVFQVPAGRSIEDFVSESRPVYKRAA